MSASIIEWEGEAAGNAVPDGAQRLARTTLLSRPGQKSKVLLGRKNEVSELLHGLEMEIDSNVGANEEFVNLRFSLDCRGETEVSTRNSLTLWSGKPRLLFLGRAKGKALGLVLEGEMGPISEE